MADPYTRQPRVFAQTYRSRFHAEPRLYAAPGRVNLIGEHTDYNEGLVMPVALPFQTMVGAAPATGTRCHVHSLAMNESCEFGLAETLRMKGRSFSGHWSSYVVGVIRALAQSAVPVRPMNLLIDSTVPIGAGLSSSAALEVATALAAIGVAGAEVDPLQVALACQRAENDYVGVRCGIMDQLAAMFGLEDHALWIDCRTLERSAVPLKAVALVICNTRVRHDLAASEYNLRRAQCEEGVRQFAMLRKGISSLRDVTLQDLADAPASIGDITLRRCRHVVTENLRVGAVRDALLCGDLPAAGALLRDSHVSLRDDFAVSCAELDLMVDLAASIPGVYGCRMTGGGFGGCTVNLLEPSAVEAFIDEVTRAYSRATRIDPAIYSCKASRGAHEVTGWN